MTGRLIPVALLAAAFLVAGCGSSPASPLSVNETHHAFAKAGVRLRPPSGGNQLLTTGPNGMRPAPVALFIGGAGFVLVYRSVADAVHARRFDNPRIRRKRVQNVVILSLTGFDSRLRTAIRDLKPSS